MGHHVDLPGDVPVWLCRVLATFPRHPGVRAVQVDSAEHVAGDGDEPGHTLFAGRVARHHGGVARGRHLGRRRGVDVVHHHAGALGGEPAGERGADPAAGAGDHDAGARDGPHRDAPAGAPGAGSPARSARVARCQSAVPKPIEELFARFRYRCAGCSQVKPMPPCS